MAEILTSGATTANSSEFALAAGDSATISIRQDAALEGKATNPCVALIQKQGSDSAWYTIGRLNDAEPSKVLTAVGNFRLQRQRGEIAFGIDKD